MSDIDSTAPKTAENRGSRFSRFHARTYEIELLVSGAVVFGLIHLPPIIERISTSYIASLDGNLRMIGILGQVYIQLVLYALIAVFVLHLAMRGFWIGLLGLESVFPDGIRWDKVKLGPAMIRQHRAHIGSLAQAVEKTDDRCSLIFSFGFLIVFIWIYFVIILGSAVTIAVGLSWLVFDGKGAAIIFWIIAGSTIGISALAELIDKYFSHRVQKGGIGERIINGMVAFAYVVSPARFIGATQLTLGSNTSNARVSVVMAFAMIGLALVQVAGGLFGEGIVRIDSLTFFPDTLREQGVDPRHYRALRDPLSVEPLVPSIQNDIVTDPYLKLFIPYYPRRHNPLLAKACPDLVTLSKSGFDAGKASKLEDPQIERASACLASLFPISIDGSDVSNKHFDFTVEQGSGLEGIVTFLPIEGLRKGRHELEILAPPKVRHIGEDDETPEPVRHLIPFWL